MLYTPHGKHLIAGKWVSGDTTFSSEPVEGPAHQFAMGSPELVDEACKAAEDAFWSFGYSSQMERADFLNTIADAIEARAEQITEIGSQETGLPKTRLQVERGRTTGQLRLFASHIQEGNYLDYRHDKALPDREPIPRPDLRLIQRPVGPVAVFGASNFPLAFSTAGGDTASALAAGCPVVVKGHSAHPGTGEIVAEAINDAIKVCGLHAGVFSLIQGGRRDVGTSLVKHPLINAVGFTGSLAGGRALFDLCAQRENPIPFFGELGSVNPMFLLPSAIAARASQIGVDWAGSLTMGAGQFCTNPGVAIIPDSSDAEAFVSATISALEKVDPQVMLTDGIAHAYRKGSERIVCVDGIKKRLETSSENRIAQPLLYETTGEVWLANESLWEEVFGPLGIIVRVRDESQMKEIARSLKGQLTCTLHIDDSDHETAQELLPILERKAGRILVNGFPTGVEVCDAMVHGGPYPASTNFGATSVGTMAIRRFLRPVCLQGFPESLLPGEISI